jgi:hypothetical protein
MEKATPTAIANKPVKKNRYFLTYSVFMNAFCPFKLFCYFERMETISLISGKIWYFPDPNNYTFQITPFSAACLPDMPFTFLAVSAYFYCRRLFTYRIPSTPI